VLISDHLNLTGKSPLSGPPPPAGYAPRFADLSEVYSARLRSLARESDPGLAEGVYAALPGPHYETPAEIRALRTLGADLVGMSTALEAIAARHLGAEVLALSLVTNLAAGLADHGLDHGEVVAAGAEAAGRIGALLASVLPQVTRA
jgi:purine-nucleoside phosphorylase